MGAVMLDTLSMVKKLKNAGVPEQQAEAQVALVYEMAEKGFATKSDIAHLSDKMDAMENRLLLKLSGIMFTLMTIAVAVIIATLQHHVK